MTTYQEVLFHEMAGKDGQLGIITLNRPEVLNALNQTMIHAIHAKLQTWASLNSIKAVIICAAPGRAFCAGGDLRLTYERCKAHNAAMTSFFNDEYHLNRFIFHFPKPYIALLDGITMGGGVGLSIHGSHRVVTDKLMFAMPETGIGFFPDVGGTYFLPRLPGKTGFYLGLAGARIGADDAVALGLAQQKVASEALPQLVQALADAAFGKEAKAAVTELIDQFKTPANPSPLLAQQAAIDICFSKQTMEDILQALQQSAVTLCQDACKAILKKSPTSLKVTLKALLQGASLSFDECMQQEYRLVNRFLQEHDFPEGIRAVIIDKDQAPQWVPPTLEAVSAHEVEKYFSPLVKELV